MSQVLGSAQLAAASRLFSPTIIREFARTSRSSAFSRLLGQTGLVEKMPFQRTVAEAYDAVFDLIKWPGSRDEYVYRTALANKILLGRHSLRTATMLNEFRVGQCKADVVILNGTSTVYEIKSEKDSLVRLARQVSSYRQVFANVYVVLGSSHLEEVMSMVPSEVGILQLSNRQTLSSVRKATENRDQFDNGRVLDALRVDEAAAVLQYLGFKAPNAPNTLLRRELREIFLSIPSGTLHEAVVKVLKESRSQVELADFVTLLPTSLRALALSIKPNMLQQQKLLVALDTPIGEALTWN